MRKVCFSLRGTHRATGISPMEREDSLITNLTTWVRERPLAGVGIAFGIGYVLGGGLTSRVTARFVQAGARLGAAALARNLIAKAL